MKIYNFIFIDRCCLLILMAKSSSKVIIPSSASEDTFISPRRYLQAPTKVPSQKLEDYAKCFCKQTTTSL